MERMGVPRGVPTWVSHRSNRRSQVNKTHQQDIYEEKEFVINHRQSAESRALTHKINLRGSTPTNPYHK